MKKVILVAIAVASLPTITLADTRVAKQRTVHRQVVTGAGVNPVLLNANASLNGNGVGADRALHIRNLRERPRLLWRDISCPVKGQGGIGDPSRSLDW